MRFGNLVFIQKTLDRVHEISRLLTRHFGSVNGSMGDYLGNDFLSALRELDGQIALSVFARPASGGTYAVEEQETQWPFALVMLHGRTGAVAENKLLDDTIEFSNPAGPGFILMASAKVARYTTKFDDGFKLVDRSSQWSISHTGLVKVTSDGVSFREKLWSPELSLCAVGLMIQAKLRERA